MEIILPTSWNDQGMNWNNPDPSDIRYSLALREAIFERINVLNVFPTPNVNGLDYFYHFLPDQHKTSMQKFVKWVYLMIDFLAQRYADVNYRGYLETNTPYRFNQSGFAAAPFPRTYNSASELQEKINEIFVCLPYNETSNKYIDFFKGAKKALDMMRYSKITRMHGHRVYDQQSVIEYNSVEEAVDRAIKLFQNNTPPRQEFTDYKQEYFSGECGTIVTNFHKTSYWSIIKNFKVEIDEIFPFSGDRKPNIICYAIAVKTDSNNLSNTEFQYNDFWCEPFGFKEGYNLINLRKIQQE